MTQKLKFEVDNISLITERSDDQLALAEIWVCHDGNNLHNMPISLETIKRAAPTLLNKFVVAEFKNGDFTTHTPQEQIIGFFPKENNLRYKEKDGNVFLIADAIISKVYADWAMGVFTAENERPVSMEIEVINSGKDSSYRDEIIDFAFIGVTILSKNTQEACVGSKATITKFSTEEAEKFYHQFSNRYADVDFNILPEIKSNAQKGLSLHKQYGGGTSVSIAMANHLVKNQMISPEKARHAFKYFESHKNREFDEQTPNREFISWMLYGGNDAHKWSKGIVEMMNELDAKRLSYFAENENTGKESSEGQVYMEKEIVGKEEKSNVEDEKEKVEETPEEEKKEEMAAETPEQEKQEDPKEEAEETPAEEKKEEMSNDQYLDVAAALAFLEAETESNQEMVDDEQEMFAEMGKGVECNMSKVAKGIFARYQRMCNKMSQMAAEKAEKEEEFARFAKENEELKKFKADVEMSQKLFAIDKALKDIEVYVPANILSELREDAINFSNENIGIWENKVKAKAFEYSKDKKEDDGVKRFALPWNLSSRPSDKDQIWK